ncbi:MAG: hypothetical protein Q6373_002690 [Candidatus Sigynarchaeota archaeon]
MEKKKAGTIIVLLIIVGAAGTGGFLAWYFLTGQQYPPCTTATPFTAFPVNMTRLNTITPLGNLNPPGHTFPTDHMYFNCNASYPDGFQVFAPGAITITRLDRVNYNPPQVLNITDDYTIEFRACRELTGRFGHVNNLSALLWSKITPFGSAGDRVETYTIAGRVYTSYQKDVSIAVPAGELLGMAGIGGGYDFWLKDSRVSLSWVNQDWTRQFQNTVCPLDYFTPALKTVMETYLRNWDQTPVDPANYCGKIAFDVAGTSQGIWTRGDYSPSGSTRAEEIGLALVRSNFNASVGAISIGIAGSSSGTHGWDEHVYTFTPTHSGLCNRDFKEVMPGASIYFYFCDQFGAPGSYTKAILLKMVDASHVRIQFVDNGGTPLPADPAAYWSEAASIVYTR